MDSDRLHHTHIQTLSDDIAKYCVGIPTGNILLHSTLLLDGLG